MRASRMGTYTQALSRLAVGYKCPRLVLGYWEMRKKAMYIPCLHSIPLSMSPFQQHNDQLFPKLQPLSDFRRLEGALALLALEEWQLAKSQANSNGMFS